MQKGKREKALERLVIDEVTARSDVSRWGVIAELDMLFEDIAAGAAPDWLSQKVS
ncbi:hypothetical protein [Paraburkholderia caribensis]|uniref:hypothetical protein n=1 Tax=Paraburkholderia caribensis TaxID=75105 RepID=UPI000A492CB0|nr:hypothetical protein [Paraburkholderia caribensis]